MEKIMEQVCQHLDNAGIKYSMLNDDNGVMIDAVLNKGETRSVLCSVTTHPTPTTRMKYVVFNAFITTNTRKGTDAFLQVEEEVRESLRQELNTVNAELVHGNVFLSDYEYHLGYRVASLLVDDILPEIVFGMMWNAIGVVAGKLWEIYNKHVLRAFIDNRLSTLPKPFDAELMDALERSSASTKLSKKDTIDILSDGKGETETMKLLAKIALGHLNERAQEEHEELDRSAKSEMADPDDGTEAVEEKVAKQIEQAADDEGSVLKQSMNDAQGY